MLLVIENVLAADEVAAFSERLARANWIDGADTAGSRSIAVKQNLQLGRDDPDAIALRNRILAKLGHHPELSRPRWPKRSGRRCSTAIRTAATMARIATRR